jgi:hypothetical protein
MNIEFTEWFAQHTFSQIFIGKFDITERNRPRIRYVKEIDRFFEDLSF